MAAIVEHNKYNSSRIYKIQSSLTDKIYIGSTCQALSQRMAGHIKDYKDYLKDNTKKFFTSYEIIKLGDAFITLIEECNYNNKQQLLSYEGEFIKLNINITVNLRIAGRSKKEYKRDNIDRIKARDVAYQIIKKEDYKIYRNKPENKQRIKEYGEQRRSEKINCICGEEIIKIFQLRHNKTKKHLQLINKLYLDELTYYLL